MLDRAPHEYPRRILVCVTGLTPQIVTETVHALAVQQRPAFMPTEIHVISTRDGVARVTLTLLDGGEDYLGKLCADYGLARPAVTLHRIDAADGSPLDDIRTPADNAAAADAITRVVADLANDPDAALHVSIAGGRKTMGYYLGYALSLFGRSQDRLSHVLVSPPYEGLVDFYYPTPQTKVLHTRDKQPVDARAARVDLADIPFVRLRDDVVPLITEKGVSFGEAVAAAESQRAPARVLVRRDRGSIVCDGVEVALQPKDWFVYCWFAWRRKFLTSEEALHRATLKGESHEWYARMTKMKADLGETGWYLDPDEPSKWTRDEAESFFSERISNIRKTLRKRLGSVQLAERFCIASAPTGSGKLVKWFLAVQPEHITFS